MINEAERNALLVEIHEAIEESALSVATKMQKVELSYPPGVELTPEESAALSSLQLSDEARSGLNKLIADACAYPLFHLFCLMDGVADIEEAGPDTWGGLSFVHKSGADEPMLHDEFYESYWLYKKE